MPASLLKLFSDQIALSFLAINGVYVVMQEATLLFNTADFAPYDPTQEVIFPPELMVNMHIWQNMIMYNMNTLNM